MIGRNFHLVDEIETRRVESLHSRIEFKMFALTSALFDQLGQELHVLRDLPDLTDRLPARRIYGHRQARCLSSETAWKAIFRWEARRW